MAGCFRFLHDTIQTPRTRTDMNRTDRSRVEAVHGRKGNNHAGGRIGTDGQMHVTDGAVTVAGMDLDGSCGCGNQEKEEEEHHHHHAVCVVGDC